MKKPVRVTKFGNQIKTALNEAQLKLRWLLFSRDRDSLLELLALELLFGNRLLLPWR